MVSYFRKGRPVGEGTKFREPWNNPSAVRTFDGKEGERIPMDEASKIIRNLRSATSSIPVPMPNGFSAAVKAARATTPPPKPKHRPKMEYVTEASAAFKAAAAAAYPVASPDAFLAKLAEVEARNTSVLEQRRSLVPRAT